MTVPETTTLVGAFIPGWETPPTPLAWQQTYVGACAQSYVLPHRLAQMHGNRPIVNIENSHRPIEDILDGSMDECWTAILGQVPDGTVIVPLAEANGDWVSYHATPEQFRQAWDRLRSLDPGTHLWAWAPDAHGRFRDWEPDEYDYYAPSIYEWHWKWDWEVFLLLAIGNRPTLLQQVGVTDRHVEFLTTADALGNTRGWKGIVYFNHHRYAFDWSTYEQRN